MAKKKRGNIDSAINKVLRVQATVASERIVRREQESEMFHTGAALFSARVGLRQALRLDPKKLQEERKKYVFEQGPINAENHRIFKLLSERMGKTDNLLDLLSGESTIPLALILAKIVRRKVHLVDALSPHVSPVGIGLALDAAKKMEIDAKLEHVQETILKPSDAVHLAATRDVTILSSGTALAPELKTTNRFSTEQMASRLKDGNSLGATHVNNNAGSLETLLSALGEHDRRVWLADNAPEIDPAQIYQRSRAYVFGVVEDLGDSWRVESFVNDRKSGMVFAKLIHE